MKEQGGYLKLYRKSLKSDVWQNPNLWRLWTYLLLRARYKDSPELVRYKQVSLKPGELIFGRNKASKDTGLSVQTIRSSILTLQTLQQVTIKTTNRFSIISIVNWDVYQSDDDDNNQQTGQQINPQSTSNQPAINHMVKEGKERRTTKLEGTSYPPVGSTPSEPTPPEPKNGKVHKLVQNCPYTEIVQVYHEILPVLPVVRVLDEATKKSIAARWREDASRQSIEWWRSFFAYVGQSDFLTGRANGWRCHLGWIVGPKNFAKIANGVYDNRKEPLKLGKRAQANLTAAEAAKRMLNQGGAA